MKQNKDREEFNQKIFGLIVDYIHDDLFKTDNCVKSIDKLYDWIETHTQKKLEEALNNILEENHCDLDGTYDYDGIAESVINLCKNK